MQAKTQLEPITVGEFVLAPSELFSIVRAFLDGSPLDEISGRLDIDLDDLAELLSDPNIFDAAITARRNLLRLMVYGPLADHLISIASGTGDSRSKVAAVKFLHELAEGGERSDTGSTPVPSTVTHNTLNVIGQLPAGGFDAVVRQVEQAQDRVIELPSTEVVRHE